MKKIYGSSWFNEYGFDEVISNQKTKKGNRICWLHIFFRDNKKDNKYVNYMDNKPISAKDVNNFPLDRIFGVELLSKNSKKYYRKYIFKKK